jgi:hypothetical protein
VQSTTSRFPPGELAADLCHVQGADRLDDLLERGGRQRTGLGEDQDAVAEGHRGGDRGDLRGGGQLRLIFGVDLAERDVRVLPAGGLEDRGEPPALARTRKPTRVIPSLMTVSSNVSLVSATVLTLFPTLLLNIPLGV